MAAARHRRTVQGRAFGLALLLAAAAPAQGAVSGSGSDGFTVVHVRTVPAAPDAVWAMLVAPGRWWNDAHTYSGKAANMTLEARAGGCWCETWGAGNSVEHGRVILAQPGQMLRLSAALGPLQALPTAAIVTWSLSKAGAGTQITLNYRVLGRASDALDKLAAPVDQVMGEQADGLAAALDGKKPR